MLLHPFIDKHLLESFGGTRLLRNDFGLIGEPIEDPFIPQRIWTIQGVYAPVPGRALGGVRAKLTDQYEFVTFCNQRDLEVLLGLGTPGRWCRWLGEEYVEPGERTWCGFCADAEDLRDDLYERELMLRHNIPGVLPAGLNVERRVHTSFRTDYKELYLLLWDTDPETGMSPDPRVETISRRWSRVEREKLEWDRMP